MVIPVVCGIIFKKDEVWMGRRPSHKHMGGKWEFPGGKVLEGESEESAVERELMEELGIRLTQIRALGKVEYDYPEKTIQLSAYLVETTDDIILHEHEEGRWVKVGSEPDLTWAPADIRLWKAIQL